MVRIISPLMSCRIHLLSLVVGAGSVVTVQSRSATTVLGVKEMKSAFTILCQSAVGPIRAGDPVLVAQDKRLMGNLPQGAGIPQK